MTGAKETKLQTLHNVFMWGAANRLGQRKEDKKYRYVTLVIVPIRNPCEPWLSIPEGFVAVTTRFGKYNGIKGSGLHKAAPYVRVSHLVSKQYIPYDVPIKECPTADDVMVEIDVNVIFHIMQEEKHIKNFIYHLGPERLQDMLKAFQEEAVRGMARQKLYTEIYDLMDTEELPEFEEQKVGLPAGEIQSEEATFEDDDDDGGNQNETQAAEKKTERKRKISAHDETMEQLETTKTEMNERLSRFGVKVYSITITNVRLPPTFTKQMEAATTFIATNHELASKHQYDLMMIENTEGRNKAMQQLGELKEEAVVKKNQRAAIENKKIDIFSAETDSIIAVIDEKMKAEIRDIDAQSRLTIAKLEAEKEEELAQIAAEGVAEVKQIDAELEGFIMQAKANAQRQVALIKTQADLMLAKQELKMAPSLKSKRDYDSKMSNLLVLNKMANNRNALVSGTAPANRDGAIAELLGAQQTSATLSLQR